MIAVVDVAAASCWYHQAGRHQQPRRHWAWATASRRAADLAAAPAWDRASSRPDRRSGADRRERPGPIVRSSRRADRDRRSRQSRHQALWDLHPRPWWLRRRPRWAHDLPPRRDGSMWLRHRTGAQRV